MTDPKDVTYIQTCRERKNGYRCTRASGHEGPHAAVPCCPVPDCDLPRKQNQMMCRTHWFRVPKELRDRIWKSVRAVHSHEYQEARNEAIMAAANWIPAKDRPRVAKPKARTCNYHGVNIPAGGKCALCEAS